MKHRHHFDMGGVAELVHGGDPLDAETAAHKYFCVPGEGLGVAGHGDRDFHLGRGDGPGLLLRARAGRIEDHGVIGVEFVGQERALEQIALLR